MSAWPRRASASARGRCVRLLSGTHDGEFFGIAATGNAVRIEGATFTVIDEQAMVIEDIHQVDYATLFRQLGAT